MSYHQLTREQRYQIEGLLAIKTPGAEIARRVGVHRSTIYRELARNGHVGKQFRYRAKTAQTRTNHRRIEKGAASRKIRGELRECIETKLNMGWSPEQIAGRLEKEGKPKVSHETIYQHVIRDYRAGGKLRYALRFGGYKQFRCTQRRLRTHKSRFRRPIEDRPRAANDRSELGHWERDLVHSKQNGPALLTIVDRMSRYVRLKWVTKTQQKVQRATLAALRQFGPLNRSITNDNGTEFERPLELEQKLGVPIYHCAPGSPWQRGSVENTNGLIRQYFPKKNTLSTSRVPLLPQMIETTLNFRPRRSLDYATPHEIFFGERLQLFSDTLMHFGFETNSGN